MGTCCDGNRGRHLPEHVARFGAVGEMDLHAGGKAECAHYLEDPHRVGVATAIKGTIRSHRKNARELVHTGRNRFPGQQPGVEI
jgi:hypothetical protein